MKTNMVKNLFYFFIVSFLALYLWFWFAPLFCWAGSYIRQKLNFINKKFNFYVYGEDQLLCVVLPFLSL